MHKCLFALILLAATTAAAPDYSRFTPGPTPPRVVLEGDITLDFSRLAIDEISSVDWLRGTMAPLPELRFSVVADGQSLIPVTRGMTITKSTVWDYFVGPGRSWQEGRRSVASLPLTLVYRPVNCSHNGVIRIEYTKRVIRRAELLVGQETCHFKRVNINGAGKATYHPGADKRAAAIRGAYQQESNARLPLHNFETLQQDFKRLDVNLLKDGLPDDHHLSTLGVYVDGKHYNNGCNTRFGPYPYCKQMLMTSFSTAKTAFAGLALMVMAQEFGPDVYNTRVIDLLPEARTSPGKWDEVTLNHLNDMSSGNFENPSPLADPGPGNFYADSGRNEKLKDAFLWPNGSPPGARFVYQTADTFIQVAALDVYLAMHSNYTDSFTYLVDRVYRPLGVEPGVWSTRRTRDEGRVNSGTAFGGMGMFFTPDAIVKIARFMAGDGRIDGKQIAHPAALDAAMQRNPNDRGLATNFYGLLYNNNTWALALKPFAPQYHCDPYAVMMTGLSGVRVFMLPNGVILYYFNDAEAFPTSGQIQAAGQIKAYCKS